ncbi:hypothetical protein JCM5296_004038 [Sporobolomyces johnsonii]
MAPKKKGQKMDLSSFLADTTTGGSWADEMDLLPTGPSAGPVNDTGLGGSHLSRNMRQGGADAGAFGRDRYDDRPQRAEVPIPTAPPYTAFVGNLTFETAEPDMEDFFTGLGVKSVRLVSGPDGKPRGFGYVEFNTVDDLKNALTLSGQDLNGRVVRISVAEGRESRFGRADEASTWERTGPLAALPGRQSSFGASRGGFGDREPRSSGGFDEIERDAPIRGGKFTPSAAPAERMGGMRGDRGPGFSGFERAPMAEVEREGPIRGGKFTPSAPEPRRTFSGEPSRADEGPWTRSGPLPPAPGQQERRGFGSGFGARTSPSEPPARRPLQLSARTPSSSTPGSPSPEPTSTASPSSKASPFGAAKPIDTTAKEREVEEKLAKQRAEAAAAKEAAAATAAAAAAAKDKDEKPKDESSKKEASKSDGAWVRRGPLPDRAPAPAAAKPKEVASPVPTATAAAAGKKDEPPHAAAAAKPALRKEGFSYSSAAGKVDEVTKGVEETKL